jgi:hypothetical protein
MPVPGMLNVRLILPSGLTLIRKPRTPTEAPIPDLLKFILPRLPILLDFLNLVANSLSPLWAHSGDHRPNLRKYHWA